MQTGSGQLYSWSSQNHMWDGTPLTMRCNHSMVFEGPENRQGPLLQLLRLTGISGTYSLFTLSLEFTMTASLLVPGLYLRLLISHFPQKNHRNKCEKSNKCFVPTQKGTGKRVQKVSSWTQRRTVLVNFFFLISVTCKCMQQILKYIDAVS